jgi:hypothetical protein
VAPVEAAGKLVVAVGKDGGTYDDAVAEDALDSETAAVEDGADLLDNDAAGGGLGQIDLL